MKKLLFALPIVVLLAAGCNSNQPVVQQKQQTNTPPPAQTQQVPPQNQEQQNTDETANWQTYNKFGVQFKYPNDWVIRQDSGSNAYGLNVSLTYKKYQNENKAANPDGLSLAEATNTNLSQAKNTRVFDAKDIKSQDTKDIRIYFTENSKKILAICKLYTNPQTIDICNKIVTTFKFTNIAQNSNLKPYTNTQYGFEFQYPYKNLSVADGYVSSSDPKGMVYIMNIFTIPHGQDRDGLVGVFNLPLSKALESLGFAGQLLPTVSYNDIKWTKLSSQGTPSDYLVERNGQTFWLAFSGSIKQVNFESIINSFKFTK